MIHIIIADDHKIFSGSLKTLLESDHELAVDGMAANGKELIALLEQKACDVVLLDINMPELDGIEAAHILYHRFPKVRIIALTMYNRPEFIKKLSSKGVKGYVLKNANPDELILAIKTVHSGGKYYSKELSYQVTDASSEGKSFDDGFNHKLSKREIEILSLIAKGKSNTEIAEQLFLSVHTVDTHRKNMLAKLQMHSVAELVKYAVQIGLTD
jgi:DNA-binding NarL/FixJ family response regulator